MRLGFIGTGEITAALVAGLCSSGLELEQITLSPRNREKSLELAQRFPEVSVASSNQDVLDASDWVVLAVLPDRGREVLAPLSFRRDHKVLSLLAGTDVDQVAQWVAPAAQRPVRIIPMPCVARRAGPIVIYPPLEEVSQFLSSLGEVIPARTEEELNLFAALSALMAPYFGLLHHVVTWADQEGLDSQRATQYMTSLFSALSLLARDDERGDLEALMSGSMTAGGLNELATKVIAGQEGFDPWKEALSAVWERLSKD